MKQKTGDWVSKYVFDSETGVIAILKRENYNCVAKIKHLNGD